MGTSTMYEYIHVHDSTPLVAYGVEHPAPVMLRCMSDQKFLPYQRG